MREVKRKLLTLGVVLFALTMLTPIVAADLTGYTQAIYNDQWDIADMGTWKHAEVEDGDRWWKHIEVENIGDETLTEAKARIWIWRIWKDGAWVYSASVIDNAMTLLNAEKIEPKTYLVDLGTVQPSHSRKVQLNFCCFEPISFVFYLSVWYIA